MQKSGLPRSLSWWFWLFSNAFRQFRMLAVETCWLAWDLEQMFAFCRTWISLFGFPMVFPTRRPDHVACGSIAEDWLGQTHDLTVVSDATTCCRWSCFAASHLEVFSEGSQGHSLSRKVQLISPGWSSEPSVQLFQVNADIKALRTSRASSLELHQNLNQISSGHKIFLLWPGAHVRPHNCLAAWLFHSVNHSQAWVFLSLENINKPQKAF